MDAYRKHSLNTQDLEPKHQHLPFPKHKATGSDPEEEGSRHPNPHDFKGSHTTKLSGPELAPIPTSYFATPSLMAKFDNLLTL
jgi:hypothetical protein